MSNFDFIEKIDSDLFRIISDAEKLYRDEYFEQSIVQTRRFAENVCRNLLGERLVPDSTFDECLATLQDLYIKNIRIYLIMTNNICNIISNNCIGARYY